MPLKHPGPGFSCGPSASGSPPPQGGAVLACMVFPGMFRSRDGQGGSSKVGKPRWRLLWLPWPDSEPARPGTRMSWNNRTVLAGLYKSSGGGQTSLRLQGWVRAELSAQEGRLCEISMCMSVCVPCSCPLGPPSSAGPIRRSPHHLPEGNHLPVSCQMRSKQAESSSEGGHGGVAGGGEG